MLPAAVPMAAPCASLPKAKEMGVSTGLAFGLARLGREDQALDPENPPSAWAITVQLLHKAFFRQARLLTSCIVCTQIAREVIRAGPVEQLAEAEFGGPLHSLAPRQTMKPCSQVVAPTAQAVLTVLARLQGCSEPGNTCVSASPGHLRRRPARAGAGVRQALPAVKVGKRNVQCLGTLSRKLAPWSLPGVVVCKLQRALSHFKYRRQRCLPRSLPSSIWRFCTQHQN